MKTDNGRIESALKSVREKLLARHSPGGYWRGRLSSSPLATSVACFALYLADKGKYGPAVNAGLQWLGQNQNPDGSWGDTDAADPGNLSSTLLCRAAFMGCGGRQRYADTLHKADKWLEGKADSLDWQALTEAVYSVYGKDRTFAVPILTMCAIAGPGGENPWKRIEPLPFELALVPRRFYRLMNLSVVSYALPALIAIGQVRHHFCKSDSLFLRCVRGLARNKTLSLLEDLQPANGGFLEAAPLTGFVVMSLSAMGLAGGPVVEKGADFLISSQRTDGSWPIDTDLATWLTTLSVNALGDDLHNVLDPQQRRAICDWLLGQQFLKVHPFTGAAAGGWGWTDKPGSVPDADDTAGALIALYRLQDGQAEVFESAKKGLKWLLNLQNSDGGFPTFCRGWGRLEFDRSCPDITAHAVAAFCIWYAHLPKMQAHLDRSLRRALAYLGKIQRQDGSFIPLWFGNPFSRQRSNPVFGTARVLQCLSGLCSEKFYIAGTDAVLKRAADFLLSAQDDLGGWGAESGQRCTIEESGAVLAGLGEFVHSCEKHIGGERLVLFCNALDRGAGWLIEQLEKDSFPAAQPVGLYFSHLWYAERLYPLIFAVSALSAVKRVCNRIS